jgi:PadR family transcriptional regulator PadR
MAKGEYMAGMLRVLILSELSRGESYGYGIARSLEDRSSGELVVRPESLYPVLHRMEQEDLLSCRWVEAENGRPRKIYSLTAKGRKLWEKARIEFIQQSNAALKTLGATAAEVAGSK